MTIIGTSFRSCHPCARCGTEGPQIWLAAETNLCYECRMPNNTTLTVHEAEFEQDIQSHTLAIEEYVGPEALAYTIQDADGYNEAGQIINEIKRHLADLDKVEKTATRPMLSALDTVRSWFKPAKTRATEASVLWKGKITTYLASQAAEQAEVQRQLQAAAKAGDKPEMRVQLAKLEQAPVAAGVSVRQIWKSKVINPALVPDEYWVLDAKVIEEHMRVMVGRGEDPVIPGVKFWTESIVAAVGK